MFIYSFELYAFLICEIYDEDAWIQNIKKYFKFLLCLNMFWLEHLYEIPRQPGAAVSIFVAEPLGSSSVPLLQADDDTYESSAIVVNQSG